MINSDGASERALEEALRRVESRADLVNFLNLLRRDCEMRVSEWENRSVPDFLSALAAWTDDMEGYFSNHGEQMPTEPTWKLIALMLAAARVYE